jgi:hypothetical protein
MAMLVLVGCCLLRPLTWGLLILSFFIPIQVYARIAGVTVSLMEILLLVTLVGCLAGSLAGKRAYRISITEVDIGFLLFGAALLLAGVRAESGRDAAFTLIRFGSYYAVYKLYSLRKDTNQAVRRVVGVFLAGAVAQALLAVWQVSAGIQASEAFLDSEVGAALIRGATPRLMLSRMVEFGVVRGYGLFINPDYLAAFLCLAGLLAAAWSTSERGGCSVLLKLTVAVCFLGILMTRSLGGLAFFALGWLFLMGRSGRIVRMVASVVSVGVAAYLFTAFTQIGRPTLQRLEMNLTLASILSIHSEAMGRFTIWARTLEVIQQHPLFGVGVGNFTHTLAREAGSGWIVHPHSLYLLTWAETGFLGLAALGYLLWQALQTSWHASRLAPPLSGMGIAALALMTHSGQDTFFWLPKIGMVFWALVGCAAAARSDESGGSDAP